jgi:hypothetical protein
METVQKAVDESGFDVKVLINGCASGIDWCAILWRRKLRPDIFPLDVPARWDYWRSQGRVKYAGPERNGIMADIAEALIIIKQAGVWTGGTLSMYREAKARNLPTYIYEI